MTRRPVSATWAVIAAAFWMALAGNGALWRKFSELGLLADLQGWAFAASMLVTIWAALTAILGLLAWRYTLKPVATLLLVVTALASYFMLSYRVVIDPGMMTNVLQTDPREAAALFDWRLALSVLALAGLPGWLLWRQELIYGRARRQLWRNPALVLAALLVMVLSALAGFQTLASVMRNHKEVRYLINPLNSLYAVGRVAAQPFQRDTSKLARIGEDARPGKSHTGRAKPPLLVLVLGETARAANFSLNGYARETNPQLQREGVASFRNAWSCGTSTAASVPCMFSNLGRAHFDDRKTEVEGLLDVLQRAGLAVLWLDNQSGCKGVCDRVPNANACSTGECLDEAMLDGLEVRLNALEPARRARGTVIVMHQMGSHGPAYHLRSPAAFKRFQPECTSAALQECSRDSVVNAYDNSIVYTDHFLARTIAWLKGRQDADTAMVYVSDHGESLGENNLYLHGLPYSVAPDVQKHVPWITWLSPGWEKASALTTACLLKTPGTEVSHDNYFHSVLGLMDVETKAYSPSLDVYAACRGS